MPDPTPNAAALPSPFATGLAGRCPRCGKGGLFDGFLNLKARCPVCDLDLSKADTGDGPAFFASFIGGLLLLAVGVWMQASTAASFWAYAALLVVGTLLIIGMIRPLKGLLTALQWSNQAEQGRFEP